MRHARCRISCDNSSWKWTLAEDLTPPNSLTAPPLSLPPTGCTLRADRRSKISRTHTRTYRPSPQRATRHLREPQPFPRGPRPPLSSSPPHALGLEWTSGCVDPWTNLLSGLAVTYSEAGCCRCTCLIGPALFVCVFAFFCTVRYLFRSKKNLINSHKY